ncbi:hypothetical protein STAFG_6398 [Streptomyces afghaniensis 772]|uniref:Uncharacterized protein n=1 Tax=Streptomyces afghaniensis 772 TaxID=1283301 RepID=S4MSI2_9ACTN|nr:hypothetical protein STAFG_6398 [Streptomyces afghaniensis 772]
MFHRTTAGGLASRVSVPHRCTHAENSAARQL